MLSSFLGHKQWPYAIVRALSDTYCRNPAIDEVLHRIATQQESSFFAFTEKLTLYGSRLDHGKLFRQLNSCLATELAMWL